MTMDELLHLAYAVQNHDETPIIVFTFEELEQFAQVIAKNEREACIRLVWNTPQADDEYVCHKDTITNAIRNRGGA